MENIVGTRNPWLHFYKSEILFFHGNFELENQNCTFILLPKYQSTQYVRIIVIILPSITDLCSAFSRFLNTNNTALI